jgi:hypothetical protein
MMHRVMAALMLCCATAVGGEADNYLCITDRVTGFSHDPATDSWDRSSFLPGARYQITATSPDHYSLEKLDKILPWSADCRRRDDLDDDSFTCESGTNTVHFNRRELRFTAFRYFGYWGGSTDSLSISIGSCFVN